MWARLQCEPSLALLYAAGQKSSLHKKSFHHLSEISRAFTQHMSW